LSGTPPPGQKKISKKKFRVTHISCKVAPKIFFWNFFWKIKKYKNINFQDGDEIFSIDAKLYLQSFWYGARGSLKKTHLGCVINLISDQRPLCMHIFSLPVETPWIRLPEIQYIYSESFSATRKLIINNPNIEHYHVIFRLNPQIPSRHAHLLAACWNRPNDCQIPCRRSPSLFQLCAYVSCTPICDYFYPSYTVPVASVPRPKHEETWKRTVV